MSKTEFLRTLRHSSEATAKQRQLEWLGSKPQELSPVTEITPSAQTEIDATTLDINHEALRTYNAEEQAAIIAIHKCSEENDSLEAAVIQQRSGDSV